MFSRITRICYSMDSYPLPKQHHERTPAPIPEEEVEGTKMTGNDIDMWSEKHVGSLALVRTILGFVNVLLGLVVIAKLFEVI